MATKTIIITVPAGRNGGLDSSILAVKRPISALSSVASPAPMFSPMPSRNFVDKFETYEEYPESDEFDMEPPRKRERLTHLSSEEKMFRRKLKNRIAAQTARDRKKAQMYDLEERIQQLAEENAALKRENMELKTKSSKLGGENGRLSEELAKDTVVEVKAESQQHICNQIENLPVVAVGSAASISGPQQQEQAMTGNVLNWLLAMLTALSSSTFCANSSEVTLKPVADPVSLSEIFRRINVLPISSEAQKLLSAKLSELLRMWKATRKKAASQG